MKHTIKYWLNKLPEPAKSQALENVKQYDKKSLNLKSSNIIDAIGNAFVWFDSPQGHDYWENIADNYDI